MLVFLFLYFLFLLDLVVFSVCMAPKHYSTKWNFFRALTSKPYWSIFLREKGWKHVTHLKERQSFKILMNIFPLWVPDRRCLLSLLPHLFDHFPHLIPERKKSHLGKLLRRKLFDRILKWASGKCVNSLSLRGCKWSVVKKIENMILTWSRRAYLPLIPKDYDLH